MSEHLDKGIKGDRNAPATEDLISETDVSEIRIVPVRNEYGLVGIASCIIDKKWFLGSIGIYHEDNKFRLTYPTKKVRNSSMTLFHPINIPAGTAVYDSIVKEYETLLAKDV